MGKICIILEVKFGDNPFENVCIAIISKKNYAQNGCDDSMIKYEIYSKLDIKTCNNTHSELIVNFDKNSNIKSKSSLLVLSMCYLFS